MSIERDEPISFHEEGTLNAVTRWLSTHDEGIAEWLKNARRAYQVDRANVAEQDRVAVLLFKDADAHSQARLGLLDVGGATIEDLENWKVWQDPNASSRGSSILEEETQGNGGKAYMFRMFKGTARFLGVAERTRNCRGFEGPPLSVERGTPGFIPSEAEGREVREVQWRVELNSALQPYGVDFNDLPSDVQKVLERRQRFTFIEGVDPAGLYQGRINAPDLLQKVLRHDQSTLAVQQMRLYAIHNGITQNGGKHLELEEIPPYPGLEGPYVYEIPAELPGEDGISIPTTQGETKLRGRLVLSTSKDNMHLRHKVLRPRWKLSYRAGHQMLGSKSISEVAPATPGSEFIYGQVELETLSAYAMHGRTRPKDGPLTQAVELFVQEKLKELARQINERRRHKQDSEELDEVQKENKLLDIFKNKFMPADGFGGDGDRGGNGAGPNPPGPSVCPVYGEIPHVIEIGWPEDKIMRVGKGVPIRLLSILKTRVRDEHGLIVPSVKLEWISDNEQIARSDDDGVLHGRHGGTCNIHARIPGTKIRSQAVAVEVWVIDHVLLTPRTLEIPLGKKENIVAEVTNDKGDRATDVLLEWSHDADDPLIVRINPFGTVMGNRTGTTSISAGARGVEDEAVWARVRVDVTVISNPEAPKHGSGFPQLLLTDRDVDPYTGQIRKGSPDQPTLWQEVTDVANNVWWLNLQSDDAAYAFESRPENPLLWRMFHAQQLVEMVAQVHMQQEFTSRGEDERPDLWLIHKQSLERNQINLKQAMWQELKVYVETGGGLE